VHVVVAQAYCDAKRGVHHCRTVTQTVTGVQLCLECLEVHYQAAKSVVLDLIGPVTPAPSRTRGMWTYSQTQTYTDIDVVTDVDTDVNTDTEIDINIDREADADTDTDTDTDTDADKDTDTDIDTNKVSMNSGVLGVAHTWRCCKQKQTQEV